MERGRILVVDDDLVNRRVLERALERAGHETVTAADGAQALSAIAEDPPDLVLLDIVMPGIDGIEVLERLKSDPATQHIPVVMISAVDEADAVIRCIETGAEDFLPKPFDAQILKARVNAGLSKMRIHDLEQARVRDVFSRFLPESTVDEVLRRTGGELRLGGVRVTATMLFCDLRGFTTFAESTDAGEVIEVLNMYLGVMTDAILDRGGTLVDYMGDGLLAIFGAPIESEDHADRALDSVRDMLRVKLPLFNEWLAARGHADPFRMGIGVNSGIVMSGNVGSERRLEYTVIGDATNTASRLEGMTKGTPYMAFIADATVELLRSPAEDLRYVDELEIRGRSARVKVWTLAEG